MTKKKKKKPKEKVLFVLAKDIENNIGVVLEALNDYVRWYDGADESDKEKQAQIKEAIKLQKAWSGVLENYETNL